MFELSDIARMCEQYTTDTGIIVTEGAMRQIATLINSVQLDPHEKWEAKNRQLDDYFERWQQKVPELIVQVAQDHELENRITTMDVVVWTARNLETLWPKNCPFGKPGEFPAVSGYDKGILNRRRPEPVNV